MRSFHCEHCKNPVYFENTRCTECGHELGVIVEVLRVTALRSAGGGQWQALSRMGGGRRYRKCENYRQHQVCNWMVEAESDQQYCLSCRLNEVIPNLSRPGFPERWYRLERSKRRLLYSLLKLGLPIKGKRLDQAGGLAFAFLSSADAAAGVSVATGHANGRITINIDEADPAIRERNRLDLNERYRTLLGHFRHEIGHYYWDRLIRDSVLLEAFRERFGDERQNYAEALQQHYRNGAPADWQSAFISPYASSHPWEDWAESWAHYLHIMDTLETAGHYGIQVERHLGGGGVERADTRFDAYRIREFGSIIEQWVPLTQALNSLNRSMGLQDLYPFVLSPAVVAKLEFVHRTVRGQRGFESGYLDSLDIDLHSPGGWLPGLLKRLLWR